MLGATACSTATSESAPVELGGSRGSEVFDSSDDEETAEAPPQLGEPETALIDEDIDWEANAVMKVLGGVYSTMTESTYTHGVNVDTKRGIYNFDCSGMAQWVLRRAAPVAAHHSARNLNHRPLAADFYRRIAKVPPGGERYGFQRITRVVDARPGDMVAWIKPAIVPSKNTGHVAFLALSPTPLVGYSDAYLLRLVDATSLWHDDDSRGEKTGFGLGTILLLVNPETGEPRAFGWVGTKGPVFETEIAIGRPVK